MSDLVAFLRARLDEDEQTAQQAQPGPWRVYRAREGGATVDGGDARGVAHRRGYDENSPHRESEPISTADAVHIARHDPARVLAEVAAKRRIVEQYERAVGREREAFLDEETDGSGVHIATRVTSVLRDVVAAMAAPHADHPDYQQEWNP